MGFKLHTGSKVPDPLVRQKIRSWLKLSLAAGIAMVSAAAFSAPDMSTTQTVTEPTTATETQIFAADTKAPLSIVLIGEKVSLNEASPVKGPFPMLRDISLSTLGGNVADYTTQGLTVAQTAAIVAAVKVAPPDVAVLFTGSSDEKENVSDEQQRVSLQALVKNLRSKNPAMRIFLVPSATNVSALTSANLRLVAADANVSFVPLGTEVSGEPYLEAMQSIKAELTSAAPSSAGVKPEAPAPPKTVVIPGKKIKTLAPEAASKREYDNQKDTLQQELNRIAGESGNVQELPASLTDNVIPTATETTETDSSTTVVGGTITKRGVEAKQAINMRPLPAVKAFRPQMPVPRNNIDAKEPALSR